MKQTVSEVITLRSLQVLKTLEVCLAEPHAACVLLETKRKCALLTDTESLSPSIFSHLSFPSLLPSTAFKKKKNYG